jgi:predicted MFS family arabinose efflux permease
MTQPVPLSALAEWRRYWPLVAATTAGMALASRLTSSFGIMLGPIEQEFGWSRAQISSGPAVVSIMGLFLATPAGYLIDRLGARSSGLLVVLISFVAIAAMSLIGSSIWHWRAAWAIFGVAGAFTSTVWLAPVSTIFHAGRGMAIAITISGTGISAALVPGIAEYFVENHGWRAGFLALGLIWCGVTLPLVWAFVPRWRSRADDRAAADARSAAETAQFEGLTRHQGFRSRRFYLLFFASLASAFAAVALILNLVPVLVFTGIDRVNAVAVAGSMGVAAIIGRIVGGLLMDRYDVRTLAVGAVFISILFPASLLALPGVVWAATAGVIAFGLTGGMTMNAIVYLTSTHLGARNFGLFYGAISTTTTVAMGLAPLLANHIYDLTKSYTPVMWAAIPSFLLAALLLALLGPAPHFSAGTETR